MPEQTYGGAPDKFAGTAPPVFDKDRDDLIVNDTITKLFDLVTDRTALNAQCEEVASLILPAHVASFFSPGMMRPYIKKTDQQVDSNGMVALWRFMAICDSMLTPKNSLWHGMEAAGANAKYLMKDRGVKLWFYNTTKKLFELRYTPLANFVGQNQSIWQSLGAFGNGALFIDDFYDFNKSIKALRYQSVPFGNIYFEFNHQGRVDGFIRIIRAKARALVKVPEWKARMPQAIIEAAKNTPLKEFIILHRVCPRDDYKPWLYDRLNMPYASYYISMDTRELIAESGYRTFPLANTRYQTAPGEENGRSPAMDVLPALKTINAQKRTSLIAGHRAATPPYLIADDGIMNMNLKPGAMNRGGISPEGKPLAIPLLGGDYQVSVEQIEMEKALIDAAFMVDLFNIALDRKSGTTATEVIDEINKRGILVAPTLGRQEDYLSEMADREIALAGLNGFLDPMPPLLREAKGEYKMTWQSPLAKAMRAGEVSGYMRTVEMAKEIVNVTGDQSALDPFDFDTAMPEIAYINGAPEPWMASPDQIDQKKKGRAQAAQTQQQIQAAPGAAALMSSQAKMKTAGLSPAMRNLAPGPAAAPGATGP